jgi:RNA polymerase sigma-70 factor (ECF subfamily)
MTISSQAVGSGWRAPPDEAPVTGPVDDATVVTASLRNPERFGEIYDRYFTPIHHYLAGRLGTDAADDLAAEVFLTAFKRRNSFDPAKGAIRPWLFGIATNLAARHHRTEARRFNALAKADSEPIVDGEADRIAERLSAQQLRGPLGRALARLSASERDVLLLVTVGGLSYQEAAAALSIAPGTVGSRLNRARARVKAALADANPESDGFPGRDNEGVQ